MQGVQGLRRQRQSGSNKIVVFRIAKNYIIKPLTSGEVDFAKQKTERAYFNTFFPLSLFRGSSPTVGAFITKIFALAKIYIFYSLFTFHFSLFTYTPPSQPLSRQLSRSESLYNDDFRFGENLHFLFTIHYSLFTLHLYSPLSAPFEAALPK